jgi:hypothetical protein
LEVFICRLQNDSLIAQAYNHTNAIIIRIRIALREIGCDPENFGIRSPKESPNLELQLKRYEGKKFKGLKLEFWKGLGAKI